MLVCKEPARVTKIYCRKGDKNEYVKFKLNLLHIGTPVLVEKGSSLKSEHKEDVLVAGIVFIKKVHFSDINLET